MRNVFSRRGIIGGIATLIGSALAYRWTAEASVGTPASTEGPFYPQPEMRPADIDNDLVKLAGAVKDAGGEVLELSGTVRDSKGKPLPGLRIEIWQCDVNGKYLHPGDDRNLVHDPGFQGFGHDITNEAGMYRFRTIRPVSYPGRTPHIHVKVLDGATPLLTSQFYIKDHPANDEDVLFRALSRDAAERVSMRLVDRGNGLEATVDVVI